jgi:hypothetical protein
MDEMEGRRELERRGERTIEEQAQAHAEAARKIAHEATQQWQRALTGVIALPAAIALAWASSAMYVALFLERGFEIFTAQTGNLLTESAREARSWDREGREREEREQPRA